MLVNTQNSTNQKMFEEPGFIVKNLLLALVLKGLDLKCIEIMVFVECSFGGFSGIYPGFVCKR